MTEILKYFPLHIRMKIEKALNEETEEIRIRANKPIILKNGGEAEKIIYYNVNSEEILEILQQICENSIYSYQSEICNGFITLKGGHRVGITGNVVFKDNKVVNINYISSLNFRIAKQMFDCGDKLLPYILDANKNTIYNTLIVSAPGGGKTTILRDIIRQLSNGVKGQVVKALTVGVVDERGEIAAMYKGVPQNDVGIRTDVLDNISKPLGLTMLIRSMAPNVIVADEIGSNEDIEAIKYGVCCGIKGIFTAHGETMEDLYKNPAVSELIRTNVIEKICFLKSKRIRKVYEIQNDTYKECV